MENMLLTICSVCYKSYPFISENIRLTNKLNANSPYSIHWLIAENTPVADRLVGAEKYARELAISQKGTALEWIEGIDPGLYSGNNSFHHAAALNLLLRNVHSRYILIMDPDFFALIPQWISTIIDKMESAELGIVSAPYNPRWFRKHRSFPVCYFLLVDRMKIDVTQIDFLPEVCLNPPIPCNDEKGILKKLTTVIRKRLIPLDRFLWGAYNRKYIGAEIETGSRLEAKLISAVVNYQLFTPVFRPREDLPFPSFWWQFGDGLYPESKRFVPRKKNVYSTRGFWESDGVDFRTLGCEEYFWGDNPFGVHFRGHPKRKDLNLARNQQAFIEAINRYSGQ